MNDEVHNWSGLYAVGAIEGDELARFEAHLAQCPDCQAEVASFAETTAALATGAAIEPPASVRAAVLTEIATTRQDSPAGVTSLAERRKRHPVPLILAAAAAVVLVIGGLFGVAYSRTATRADNAEALAAVLSDTNARTINLEGDQQSGVRMVWSPTKNQAVLLADDLAAPKDDKTYELWSIKGGTPSKVALFRPDENGSVSKRFDADLSGSDAVGVTVEPAGGSAAPTSDIILSSSVT